MSKIQITCDTPGADIYIFGSSYYSVEKFLEDLDKYGPSYVDKYQRPFYTIKRLDPEIGAIAIKEGYENSEVAFISIEDDTPLKFPTPVISKSTFKMTYQDGFPHHMEGAIYIDNLKEIINLYQEVFGKEESSGYLLEELLITELKVGDKISNSGSGLGAAYYSNENYIYINDSYGFINDENSQIFIRFNLSGFAVDEYMNQGYGQSTSFWNVTQLFEPSDFIEIPKAS